MGLPMPNGVQSTSSYHGSNNRNTSNMDKSDPFSFEARASNASATECPSAMSSQRGTFSMQRAFGSLVNVHAASKRQVNPSSFTGNSNIERNKMPCENRQVLKNNNTEIFAVHNPIRPSNVNNYGCGRGINTNIASTSNQDCGSFSRQNARVIGPTIIRKSLAGNGTSSSAAVSFSTVPASNLETNAPDQSPKGLIHKGLNSSTVEGSKSPASAITLTPPSASTLGRNVASRVMTGISTDDRNNTAAVVAASSGVSNNAGDLSDDPRYQDYNAPESAAALPDTPYANFSRSSNFANERLSSKEITGLYVRNVPLDLKRDDLGNMFRQFGVVLSVFLKIPDDSSFPTTWAIVKVSSMRVAVTMLEKLNSTPPFHFRVELALTEEERNNRRINRDVVAARQQQVSSECTAREASIKKVIDSFPTPQASVTPHAGIGRGRVLVDAVTSSRQMQSSNNNSFDSSNGNVESRSKNDGNVRSLNNGGRNCSYDSSSDNNVNNNVASKRDSIEGNRNGSNKIPEGSNNNNNSIKCDSPKKPHENVTSNNNSDVKRELLLASSIDTAIQSSSGLVPSNNDSSSKTSVSDNDKNSSKCNVNSNITEKKNISSVNNNISNNTSGVSSVSAAATPVNIINNKINISNNISSVSSTNATLGSTLLVNNVTSDPGFSSISSYNSNSSSGSKINETSTNSAYCGDSSFMFSSIQSNNSDSKTAESTVNNNISGSNNLTVSTGQSNTFNDTDSKSDGCSALSPQFNKKSGDGRVSFAVDLKQLKMELPSNNNSGSRMDPRETRHRVCIRCGISGVLLRCSVCKAGYCTTACQLDDWYYHRTDCKSPPPLEYYDDTADVSVTVSLKAEVKKESKTYLHEGQKQLKPQQHEDVSLTLQEESLEDQKPHLSKVNAATEAYPTITTPAIFLDEVDDSVAASNLASTTNEVTDSVTTEGQMGIAVGTDLSFVYPVRSVCTLLDVGQQYSGMVTTIDDFKNFTLLVFVEGTEEVLRECSVQVEESPVLEGFKPRIGDLIASQSLYDDSWCRSYVYDVASSGRYSVCHIDFGYIETVTMVKPVPTGICESYEATGLRATIVAEAENNNLEVLGSSLKNAELMSFIVFAKQDDGGSVSVYAINEDGLAIGTYLLKSWYQGMEDMIQQTGQNNDNDATATALDVKNETTSDGNNIEICDSVSSNNVPVVQLQAQQIEIQQQLSTQQLEQQENLSSQHQFQLKRQEMELKPEVQESELQQDCHGQELQVQQEVSEELQIQKLKLDEQKTPEQSQGIDPQPIRVEELQRPMQQVSPRTATPFPAAVTKPVSKGNLFLMEDLKSLALDNGEKFTVLPVWNQADDLFVQLVTDELFTMFQKLMTDISDHCQLDGAPECVREGELVCGAADDLWYRGLVLKVSTNAAGSTIITLYFVDFGNIESVDISKIRPFVRRFLDVPVMCIRVAMYDETSVSGNDNLTTDALKSSCSKIKDVADIYKELIESNTLLQMVVVDKTVACSAEDGQQTSKESRGSGNGSVQPTSNDTSDRAAVGDGNHPLLREQQCLLVKLYDSEGLLCINDTLICMSGAVSKNNNDYNNSGNRAPKGDVTDGCKSDVVATITASSDDAATATTTTITAAPAAKSSVTVASISATVANISAAGADGSKKDASSTAEGSKKDVSSTAEGSKKDVSSTAESAPVKNTDVELSPAHLMYEDCKSLEMQASEDVELVILCTLNTHSVMVIPQKDVGLMAELEQLSTKMNEYCNCIKTVYYRPAEGEVVLAKFSEDGLWYRAACITVYSADGVARVQFVDYGNIETVLFDCMVQMISGFMNALPVLALHCVISGCPTEALEDPAVTARVQELLPAFSSISAASVEAKDPDNLTYTVHLPQVLDVLTTEGLLPSTASQ